MHISISIKDIVKVMKMLSMEHVGRYDNEAVLEIVKQLLIFLKIIFYYCF